MVDITVIPNETQKALDADIAKGRRDTCLVAHILHNAGLSDDWIHNILNASDRGRAHLEALAMLGDADAIAALRYFGLDVPAPLHVMEVRGLSAPDMIAEGVVETIGRRIGCRGERITVSGAGPVFDGTYTRSDEPPEADDDGA